MAAEAWPTEAMATAAVDAAARKIWELNGDPTRTWDDLDAQMKLAVRNSALTLVWAALEALPDPRYVAWAEGYSKGCSDEQVENWSSENPYPDGS